MFMASNSKKNPRQKSEKTKKCAALDCTSNWRKTWKHSTQLKFHNFPLNRNLQLRWIEVVGRKDLIHKTPVTLRSNYYICSRHFPKWCYLTNSNLKRFQIPSLFGLKMLPFSESPKTSDEKGKNLVTQYKDSDHLSPLTSKSIDSSNLSDYNLSIPSWDFIDTSAFKKEMEFKAPILHKLLDENLSNALGMGVVKKENILLENEIKQEITIKEEDPYVDDEISINPSTNDLSVSNILSQNDKTSHTSPEKLISSENSFYDARYYKEKLEEVESKLNKTRGDIPKLKEKLKSVIETPLSDSEKEEIVLNYLRHNLTNQQSNLAIHILQNEQTYCNSVKEFSKTLFTESPSAYDRCSTILNLPDPSTFSRSDELGLDECR